MTLSSRQIAHSYAHGRFVNENEVSLLVIGVWAIEAVRVADSNQLRKLPFSSVAKCSPNKVLMNWAKKLCNCKHALTTKKLYWGNELESSEEEEKC